MIRRTSSQDDGGSDTLTTGEVAALCGVSFRTVLRWIDRGLLQAYKLPGRGDRRITRAELHRFTQANEIPIPDAEPTREQRVLVVDDEPAMAHAIERALRMDGRQIAVALSGFEAGALLATWQPDVLTLDLRMPGMDGFDVLRYLDRSDFPRQPKVLVISADSEQRLHLALAAGAHAILRKPFSNDELQRAVADLLN